MITLFIPAQYLSRRNNVLFCLQKRSTWCHDFHHINTLACIIAAITSFPPATCANLSHNLPIIGRKQTLNTRPATVAGNHTHYHSGRRLVRLSDAPLTPLRRLSTLCVVSLSPCGIIFPSPVDRPVSCATQHRDSNETTRRLPINCATVRLQRRDCRYPASTSSVSAATVASVTWLPAACTVR